MKKKKAENLVKQIICIIIFLMLCNFIMPNYAYAASENDSGTVFAPFCKFITFLCDNIMQFMQNTFVSVESIAQADKTYNFQYSPGVIFSGTVPAFDINFITPNTEVKTGNSYGQYIKDNIQTYFTKKNTTDKAIYESATEQPGHFTVKGKVRYALTYSYYTACYWTENDTLHIACEFDEGWKLFGGSTRYRYYYTTCSVNDPAVQSAAEKINYSSIAEQLQPTIATWYNALRRIALVGLLSVLVYIGIRIVISSASGKENGKYKKMLTDWLIALCLLFTLHYIMNITLIVTQKISGLFNNGETDQILNVLRTRIAEGKVWEEVVAEVIMYVVMTLYTVMFSFQYLKRVLYMGFFTMIAPLITLTYPLDKIKDSKAQAFTMWIREYIFNALIQVVHLVVYYVLVGSALSLVEVYPLYGVIAIGFITQGEKIIRKMFGFDNATTIGTMGAAATGGLVATALNKLQKVSAPNKKAESSKNDIRMSSNKSSISNAKDGNKTDGLFALGGKYIGPGAKALLGAGMGVTGAVAGLAAGISQGDISAALTGAAVGAKAGKGAVQGIANKASLGNIKNSINNLTDTWNEGAYGAEYARRTKANKRIQIKQ